MPLYPYFYALKSVSKCLDLFPHILCCRVVSTSNLDSFNILHLKQIHKDNNELALLFNERDCNQTIFVKYKESLLYTFVYS